MPWGTKGWALVKMLMSILQGGSCVTMRLKVELEHLPSKCEALSSNPSTAKKKKWNWGAGGVAQVIEHLPAKVLSLLVLWVVCPFLLPGLSPMATAVVVSPM
jgi:hypothetical protein